MKTRLLCLIIMSLSLAQFAFGGSDTNQPPPATTATQSPTAAVTQQTSQAPAPAEAEPTETEMREAVQRHLDNINSQMRPPPAPSTSSNRPQYTYSPYWHYGYGYYQKNSKESDYENWTDVARRANATARVEITSFKKIRCKPEPDQGGFSAEYIAELELRGNNPAAQEIMQTSGKRLKGFFYKGDKGWIFGEAKNETK